MNNTKIYRKNYKGEMLVVGHLNSKGTLDTYATFIDPDESYEENRKSHKTLYYKNELGSYEEIFRVKEQGKLEKCLLK